MIRILVADDAPFIREIVRHIVAGHKIEIVDEACNGDEAIAKAIALRPDLLLLDLVMPQRNGIDVAREVARAAPRTKIIAMSTEDQEQLVQNALLNGCAMYLKKPFSKESLLDAIHSMAEEN